MYKRQVDSPLLSKREVKSISLVCITADRGLCGGYNTNIIKKVEIRYAELVKQGYQVLSTIKGIPFSFAKAESPSKSGMLNRGFPIDSTYIALVLSSILFLKLSILSPSANLWEYLIIEI